MASALINDVPYISQWDDTAHLARGDCGIVAACMIALARGIKTTPDEMIRKANLPIGQHTYDFPQVIQAANAVGLTLLYHYPARQGEIEAELVAGRPAVTLLRYGSFSKNQDDFDGSHFVTVVGFDPDTFIINDPDWWGARRKEGAQRRVPRKEFETAIGLALNPTGNKAWQSLFVK